MTDRMDDQNLISKKELLSKYGISYGALYRWKRKGLIPEEWFIKKATVTGQETFFPRETVCKRIELIQNKKEDVLLDELAHRINESETVQTIVLSTIFGDKSFRLGDIKAIHLDNGNGKAQNITEQVMALIARLDQENKS